MEEAFERRPEAEFTLSAPFLYNTCVRGLVGRTRIHSRQWEERLLKGRNATECANWEWCGQKLLHGWTREFQDRGAYLWLTHYCRCPGDDTVSVPIYQSLPPFPAWPPLDWRKPASAACLLTSSRAGTPLAAASAPRLTCAHHAASQASVPMPPFSPLGCCLFTSISVLSLVTPQSEQAQPFLLCQFY